MFSLSWVVPGALEPKAPTFPRATELRQAQMRLKHLEKLCLLGGPGLLASWPSEVDRIVQTGYTLFP